MLHLCPAVNLSLQLKHSPCARRRCISSHESRLMGVAGGVWVMVGYARLLVGDWNNFHCLDNCSSFIRARLIASFNVRGLNSRISFEISNFSPPIKVPTNAFCVHPWTRLPNFSNSFWYSRNVPVCLTCDSASSKSSQSVGPKRAQSSSTKISHVTILPSSW